MGTMHFHALIRKVMDGKAGTAKRKLVAAGGEAVEPILDALAGGHGRFHPDHHHKAMNDLMGVLAQIAQKDPKPLAAALATGVPSINAAMFALGHSNSRHATQIMRDALDHHDGALRAIATYHVGRGKKPKAQKKTAKKKAAKKRGTKKAAKRKAAKKRSTRKKKAKARR